MTILSLSFRKEGKKRERREERGGEKTVTIVTPYISVWDSKP
jgi:hypothetical protein